MAQALYKKDNYFIWINGDNQKPVAVNQSFYNETAESFELFNLTGNRVIIVKSEVTSYYSDEAQTTHYADEDELRDFLNLESGGFFFEPAAPIEVVPPSEGLLSQDFLLEVAKGNVPGHSLVQKFGSATGIPSSLTVVATAKTYQTPTVLTSLEVVSDDANDNGSGTGARTVEVQGIGPGWVLQSETITLNGLTPVALANQYFRIFRMKVTGSGTYSDPTQSSHNSTITLQVSGGGTTWATIIPELGFGLGQTEIAAYTIPSGKYGLLISKNVTIEASKSANVFLFVREGADIVTPPYGSMRAIELDRNISERIDKVPKGVLATLPQKTDVGFLASSVSGTTAMSIEFEILLIDL